MARRRSGGKRKVNKACLVFCDALMSTGLVERERKHSRTGRKGSVSFNCCARRSEMGR
jgi:hypothetical protein